MQKVLDARSERIAQALEAAAQLAREQGWTSLALLAEVAEHRSPHIEVRGRWETDPTRLLGELVMAANRLARLGNEERDAAYGP